MSIGLGILMTIVMAIAVMAVLDIVDSGTAVREQRRYRELVGAEPLTLQRQTFLALDAQSDYQLGAWNSSLDYLPSWALLPPVFRARWEGRPGAAPFATIAPASEADMRVQLDRSARILTGTDALLWAVGALDADSLSRRYRSALASDMGPVILARMSALTGREEVELCAGTEPDAPLVESPLRGADAQRVIAVIRECYVAGLVDAETAWEVIERAASEAFAAHGDWGAYWASVRLGRAFQADDLGQTMEFDDALARLRHSDWPAARIMRDRPEFRALRRLRSGD